MTTIVTYSEEHLQALSDAAVAWQRAHTTHPSWCVDHDYGDGSGAGSHQSAVFKAAADLTVDLVASAIVEEEPEVRVIIGTEDVYLSPAAVEPFIHALRQATAVLQDEEATA